MSKNKLISNNSIVEVAMYTIDGDKAPTEVILNLIKFLKSLNCMVGHKYSKMTKYHQIYTDVSSDIFYFCYGHVVSLYECTKKVKITKSLIDGTFKNIKSTTINDETVWEIDTELENNIEEEDEYV